MRLENRTFSNLSPFSFCLTHTPNAKWLLTEKLSANNCLEYLQPQPISDMEISSLGSFDFILLALVKMHDD